MKLLFGTVAMVSGVLFAVSMASANPALLPKHEGYPMKNSGSPVNGQATANDPGQSDARLRRQPCVAKSEESGQRPDHGERGCRAPSESPGSADPDCSTCQLCHEDYGRSQDRLIASAS